MDLRIKTTEPINVRARDGKMCTTNAFNLNIWNYGETAQIVCFDLGGDSHVVMSEVPVNEAWQWLAKHGITSVRELEPDEL